MIRKAANMLKAKRVKLAKAPKKSRSSRKEWGLVRFRGMAIFLLIVLFGGIGIIGFVSGASAGRIADGVMAGPVMIGGLTPKEAEDELNRQLADYSLKFRADGLEAEFNPIITRDENGKTIAKIDINKTVNRAYEVGRQGGIRAAIERARSFLFGKDIGLPFKLDRKLLENELQIRLAGIFSPAVDAQIKASIDSYGRINMDIIPERPGTNLNVDEAASVVESRLKNLSREPIDIDIRYDQPKISLAEAEKASEGIEQALSRAPLTLVADKTVWSVSKNLLASWLDAVHQEDGNIRLGFNSSALKKYLESKAPSFFVAPVNAIFEMKEGKVTRLEPSQDGQKLDIDGSIAILDEVVFGDGENTRVELPIVPVEPEITTIASNPYGVKEIIGIGSTNFRGSPQNRRINIAVGAATLNGMVIPPDTEFSLMKALGEIDAEHGYKQELVIKENKTVPEFGGGLCQIGTTTFRTALSSGLPITERRNHSYRVSYYERDGSGKNIGPGKDATIYDPWPDLKFRNDTGNPIVIMTDIEGDKLEFTFWGVKDGRTAEESEVQVWDITPPPEKRLVPSEDLPPGEEKCTESPHPGAKAAFNYTIKYADGTEDVQRFYSLYRPWGEVCLVGIDPNAPPLPESSGSGTDISADVAGAQGE